MTEHARSLARERYEDLHDGNGMTVDEIRHEAQRMAVWDIQSQHFFDDGVAASVTCTRMAQRIFT